MAASLLSLGCAYAQQSVNTSGGNATGSGGQVSYSIGQAAYTAISAPSGSVNQGVQHPFEIYTLLDDNSEKDLTVSVFPNPTPGVLTLRNDASVSEKRHFRLMDLQGKELQSGEMQQGETQVNMLALPSATYLVHVFNAENKKVQSFKIIKK